MAAVAATTTTSCTNYHSPQIELATWSSNTTSSFNGQVLSIEGSLGYGDGCELFRDSHVVLERQQIYGLVAPNGSGKTSLVKALPSLFFGSNFRLEYLCADDIPDTTPISNSVAEEGGDASEMVSARNYCLSRVTRRVQEIEQEIERLESLLDSTDITEDSLEDISNQLGDLYDIKDELEVEAAAKADQMFTALNFGNYVDMPFLQLSSGWRYKCQLIAALLSRPDCLAVDEPSFLDTAATSWFISEIQHLAKTNHAMVVLISHKEALMEELCDRILYLNPASKKLTVYNCSFREFQAAHSDRVAHAKRSKENAEDVHKEAKTALGNLQKRLVKNEKNFQKRRDECLTDKRWIVGKCKEAKQKADHSAASKLKRTKKLAAEAAAREEELREFIVSPLQLESADATGSDITRPLVELVDVSFQYEGSEEVLLEYVDVQVAGTDKILIRGSNGQGKTTLVNLILGRLEATSGEVRRQPCVAAHFQQDALSTLIHQYGHETAIDFLRSKHPSAHISTESARTYFGRFGLKGSLCLRPIRTFSAGQRVRLWLAQEFWGQAKPSLLILDEATENLDKETTDTLLESLSSFSAAILAISHDDYFCDIFPANQLWEVGCRRVRVQFC